MASINTMVQRVSGLVDTNDLTDWESDFVTSVVEQTNDGKNTTSLTEKQIDVLERIFRKHFAA